MKSTDGLFFSTAILEKSRVAVFYVAKITKDWFKTSRFLVNLNKWEYNDDIIRQATDLEG